MKLYAISGLGADYRVFEKLKLNCEILTINWIKPLHKETLKSYASRLTSQIDQSEPFGLIGVSFGGAIAIELSKILQNKFTIIISSVETYHDMRFLYRIIGKTGIIRILPKFFFNLPERLAYILFGTKNKKLLT